MVHHVSSRLTGKAPHGAFLSQNGASPLGEDDELIFVTLFSDGEEVLGYFRNLPHLLGYYSSPESVGNRTSPSLAIGAPDAQV